MYIRDKLGNLIKLIKHDIVIGVFNNWLKYLLAVIIFLFPCMVLSSYISANSAIGMNYSIPTLIDHLIYFFKGMAVYIPSPDNPFQMPLIYLMLNIYLAFIVGSYPLNDLYGSAQNILIRTRSRWRWWLSKCIWNVISVLVYYLIFYITCFIYVLNTGLISFKPTELINTMYSSINASGIAINDLLFAIIIIPILTSIAISLMQMTLAFIIKPLYSFIIVASYFVASAYFFTPLLIGNYPMLLRNSLALEGGINSGMAVIVNLLVIALSIIIGNRYFKSFDILDKSGSSA